jgi:uncharacterized MAPEG superfamily protein
MHFEYQMLAVLTFLYLLAFLPSSIAKYQSFGPKWLMSNRNPLAGRELRPWGARAERAYLNLKDNYPPFVTAILLLGILDKFDPFTAWLSGIFVSARIVHFIAYGIGNFPFRFGGYGIGLLCNLILVSKIFF